MNGQAKAVVVFSIADPKRVWDMAHAAHLRSGGGTDATATATLGTRDEPDLGACMREIVGDGITSDAWEII